MQIQARLASLQEGKRESTDTPRIRNAHVERQELVRVAISVSNP